MKYYGLVLAGGKSSRMGTNKAFLTLKGQTLLQRQFDLLKEVLQSDEVFVSCTGGHSNGCEGLRSASFATCNSGQRRDVFDGYPCIEDQIPGLGPIGGIYSSMSQWMNKPINQPINKLINEIPPDNLAMCILPVDMPFIGVQALGQLLECAKQFPEYDGYHFTGLQLPLVLRHNQKVYTALKEVFESSKQGRSIRNLLGSLATLHVESSVQFENLNTPEDYERVLNRI